MPPIRPDPAQSGFMASASFSEKGELATGWRGSPTLRRKRTKENNQKTVRFRGGSGKASV
ncbi:hypothetical protein THTE_4284 [Thermogutta terrifontis]|uniref:Uncharacterized protein n=1 Tax=Thermogutta terrifontis TaxID=1331910 RepID=A0A286RLN5_9BACT|nr:hypothetical protein THTE_4284 [Thermogutta terrifontis]